MEKFIIVLCAVVIFTLTGCSSEQTNSSTFVQTNEVEPNQPPEAAPDVVIEPEVTPTPEPIVVEQPSEPIIQNYHMTSSYFIKPNNEQDTKNVVLLTFDDGPKDEVMLTRLLDILDKHEAKAIFFVNGYRVKQNPELLKLIHQREQIIGNHSWDHINLKKETSESINNQISSVQNIVMDLTDEAPVFFRPPHGAGNDDVRTKVKEEGMLYMTWSNGSLDWADNKNDPQGVIDSVMDQLMPGSNILMHELEWTVDALDELLTKIEEQGYRFVDPRTIELEVR